MSSVTYEELLREAMVDLSEMQEQETFGLGRKLGQDKKADFQFFMQHWSAMYLKYVQIARKLETVHDQILHPQKRGDVRILLDSCLGRMLEMKFMIVTYCGEYVNLDEALVDLKLTPETMEIPIPSYFTQERAEEIANRRQLIQDTIAEYKSKDPAAPVVVAEATQLQTAEIEIPLSLEQAILMLQCNERGRQGRQRARFHKTLFDQTKREKMGEPDYSGSSRKDQAATKIQKIVAGYLARKHVKHMLQSELEFLGMEPSAEVLSLREQSKASRNNQMRRTKQQANITELMQEMKEMRSKIKSHEGGSRMEEMLDEILMHLANVRSLSKEEVLPGFPTEEEGGSLALLGRMRVDPDEEAKKAEAEAAAGAAAPGKKAPPKPKGKDTKKKGDEEEEALPTLGPSRFWDRYTGARERYAARWHSSFQQTYFENKDFDQKFDELLLRDEILLGAGGTLSELRRCVDQLVRIELQNMEDRANAGGKKKKKGKKSKKAKKIKVKDPSGGKELHTYTAALVYNNILQLTDEKHRLSNFLGSHNMMGSVMEEHIRLQSEQADEVKTKWQSLLNNWNDYVEKSLQMSKEQFELLFKNYCNQTSWMFEPSSTQVRQAVTEYCILPLGSQVIHDLAPNHKAVMFYGFGKSGKTMLTHAVCNETGAYFFNLSPANLQGSLSIPKTIQMVFRMARSLAPSVIYIDQCEKIFTGKKKKKTKGDPIAAKAGKMKKDLIQQLKELDVTDRVLVIGNSRAPWDGDLKDLAGFFKAMVCCVHPDYASRMEVWQTLIKRKGVDLPSYHDYEMLAYMSNKYTSGTIAQIVEETLTDKRLQRVSQRPIKVDEFLPALSRAVPIFREEYDMMKEFVMTLPLTMRRVMESDFKEEEVADPKAKGKAAAKGKGKK